MRSLIILMLVLLSSCAQQRVNQRVSELESQLNPMLGSSEENFVLQVGAPYKTDEVAGLKIYRYYQSYGHRSTASASAYSNQYGTNAYGNGQTWETYDTVNVYFRDGIMIKWDGNVQR